MKKKVIASLNLIVVKSELHSKNKVDFIEHRHVANVPWPNNNNYNNYNSNNNNPQYGSELVKE